MRDQLRRCLNDDSLPLEARIMGALIRLYALTSARIVELTVDAFHQDETGAYITFGGLGTPWRISSMAPTLTAEDPGYLFPGHPPSRPRSAGAVSSLLTRHGLATLAARNTAMIE